MNQEKIKEQEEIKNLIKLYEGLMGAYRNSMALYVLTDVEHGTLYVTAKRVQRKLQEEYGEKV